MKNMVRMLSSTIRLISKKHLGAFLLSLGSVLAPVAVHAQIENPIGACNSIEECIGVLVQAVLGLAAIVALAFIVYGGFLYITAAGNEDQIKSGKNAVWGAVIGLIVIGLAFAIVEFVARALGADGGGGAGGG